jgi:pyruvate dehydrogenase E2 component (dihydrolipoamide acetyltransferase)
MATEVILPRQGQSVESCIILEWKKQEGDTVTEGDVLCEVETDKASFEVESTASGTVLKHLVAEGDDVPVLAPIAVVGKPGEDIASGEAQGQAAQGQAAQDGGAERNGGSMEPAADDREAAGPERKSDARDRQETQQDKGGAVLRPDSAGGAADTGPVEAGARQFVSPRARNIAAAKGLDLSQVSGTGPGGRIIERDVLSILGDREPISPAAIAEMVETGRSAPSVGTGPGGRVVTRDLKAQERPSEETAAASSREFPGPVEEIEVKGVRKLIAERMHASLLESAQLTLNSAADATAVLAYRRKLKAADHDMGLAGITINDLILYVVSRALRRHPRMNATLSEGVIRRFERVHLGFAVDTERGLMVPVIRNADTKTLRQIGEDSSRLAEACTSGKIDPEEMSGGTFTVTNLGSLGVTSFTPVLNTPQVGILGVGSAEPKPVLVENEYIFKPHIGLSLTIDHRAVDGAPGARFLREVAQLISEFELTLAD